MTSRRPPRDPFGAIKRLDGSALRESMTPAAIRARIRRGPNADQRWPANSVETNPAAKALDAATRKAGNNEKEG